MKTKEYLVCGVFAAVMCVSSVLAIPIFFTPVPITLQILAIGIISATLGGKKAALTALIYVLLGCFGLPVFSGMKGGIGVVAGATGGYIWGFIPFALISGTLIEKIAPHFNGKASLFISFLFLLIGLFVDYTCGTIQIMNVSNINLKQALTAAVFPFIVVDSLKLAAAVYISCYLKKALPMLSKEST